MKRKLLLFCLITLPITSVFAQDTLKTFILPEVTVQGHYDNAVGTSDAASQGVIRGELLNEIPLLRPGEALETVPGLVVTQHSGDGKANQYFLRGYNLDHGIDFATNVDGVPVNMPTSAHGQGYSDVNFMIPELVERIDYRKGPYFAENGDFSSAGSANIQYRRNLDHNIADLTFGEYGYLRALLAGSGSLSLLGSTGSNLLGAVELMHNDGPWTNPEDLRKISALIRLSNGNTANGWSLDAIYYDAKWNATDQVPLELINSGQLGRFSSLDPTDGGNTGRAILTGEWHTANLDGYTKASAYIQHYRLKLWSNFTYYELRPETGDQFQQAEDRNIFGGQVVRGLFHGLLGNESNSEIGLQVRHDNIKVSLKNTEARVPFETVADDHVREMAIGLYLQNTTTWTKWLRTLAGLRWDNVFMDISSYARPQYSGSASGSRISPKLSLILGPWEKTEFFINAGKGFHSNDARGVIHKADPASGEPANRVQAIVSNAGMEIGLRTEIIPGLQSSVAVWSLNSSSEIVYVADEGSTEPKGASKRYGLEWNNHWIVNRWLMLDADLAWTYARYRDMNANGETGNRIPNAVSNVALIRAAVHDLGGWSAGIEGRYIGSYPLSQDGSLTAPSAFVVNMRIRREIFSNMAISLDILNLFNRQYFDIAYQQDYRVTPSSPVVPSGMTVHPGEPRQFRMTLSFRY